LNSVTSEQSHNLRAGFSPQGKINDYNKVWNFINSYNFLFFINNQEG